MNIKYKKYMKYPKLLVISNNSFSKTNANGRTLGNFLINWNKENIAQICISNEGLDYDICNNYFILNDINVVKSYIYFKEIDGIIKKNQDKKKKNNKILKFFYKKNSFTMLIRNHIYSKKRWMGKKLINWINEFNPEIVLIQAGDFPFFLDFSIEVAQKYNIPLFIYNSEEYYFKDYNYFNKARKSIFYNIFHRKLVNSIENIMKIARGCIYITEDIRELYNNTFNHKSISILTSATIRNEKSNVKIIKGNPQISYIGNLFLDRHKGLIEIANTLREINLNYCLNIYGKIPNKEVEKDILKCENINYCGFISYEEVKKIMYNSDILIHTESQDTFYIRDIKYGFSTKIADSLSSGVPFLMYASKELTSTKYLLDNECAFVADSKEKLKETIIEALYNDEKRENVVNNALKIAEQNHDVIKNAEKFEKFIFENM